MTQVIALTGATGFIGSALCRRLLAAGYRVRALARSPGRLAPAPGLQVISGALDDSHALAALVDGADAVIYCAGSVRGRCLQDFRAANVDGLRALLAALGSRNPGARLLYFSSLVARAPGLSWYAESKAEGERLLCGQHGTVDWTIIRPPAVYGTGDREMMPLFRLMARGVALVPGDPGARVSLLHIDDLVEATMAWLEQKVPPRQIFCLADPVAAGYSWAEVAAIAARHFGRKVRLLRVPRPVLDSVANINQWASGVLGYAPMLTPAKLRELRHPDWVCDYRAFADITHWQPRLDLTRGLALTLPQPCSSTKEAA